MRIAKLSIACAAIALLPATSFAQDGTWNLNAGVSVFNGPDSQTGVYDLSGATATGGSTVNALGIGLNLGFDASVPLGLHDDLESALRLHAFGMIGHASGSTTNTYTGSGVVVIPGYTTPSGTTITLTTDNAGNAVSDIVHTNPQGGTADGNITLAGGVNNNYAVGIAPGDNSFSYAGATVNAGDVGFAAGAVGASDGGIFIAAGDLTGLAITTSFTQDVIYLGKDITLALSGDHGDWKLTGYAGPSYRLLGQRNTTTTTADLPEAEPTTLVFPDFSMKRVEDLTSHYLGGVVGGSISTVVSDTTKLTIGAEGGVYYTIDSLSGTESYTVAGGTPTVVPSTTVTNATQATGSANGWAFAARGNAAFTVDLSENQQITFGGQVEYLSRVATVTRPAAPPALGGNTYVAGSPNGTATYNAAADNLPILSFGDMWNFTGTITFSGQF